MKSNGKVSTGEYMAISRDLLRRLTVLEDEVCERHTKKPEPMSLSDVTMVPGQMALVNIRREVDHG